MNKTVIKLRKKWNKSERRVVHFECPSKNPMLKEMCDYLTLKLWHSHSMVHYECLYNHEDLEEKRKFIDFYNQITFRYFTTDEWEGYNETRSN